MRWFVGIPIPIETARELAERAAHAPISMNRARLLVAEDMHLTLRFFGEIAAPRVAAIGAALLPLRQAAFAIDLTGVGAFRSVGALYAGVAPSSGLNALVEAVSEALAWRGFPRELRPFHPHVTLARVRRALPQAELERWSEGWGSLRFVADRLALFRSRDCVESFEGERKALARGGIGGVDEGLRRYDIAQTFAFSEVSASETESL